MHVHLALELRQPIVQAPERRTGVLGKRIPVRQCRHALEGRAGGGVLRFQGSDRLTNPLLCDEGHRGRPALERGHRGKENRVLLGHVLQQLALQVCEGALERQQDLWQPIAVAADDLVDHRAQAGQLVDERAMEPALDVCHQLVERPMVPIRFRLHVRAGRVQLGDESRRVELLLGTEHGQGHLAAAAEVDAMALEHLDRGGAGGGDVSDERGRRDVHVGTVRGRRGPVFAPPQTSPASGLVPRRASARAG